MSKTEAQTLLGIHIQEFSQGFNVESEFRFAPPRNFRFDWAVPGMKLAAELHGGIWITGHHTRGQGFQDDREKANLAVSLGWALFEFTTQDVMRGKDLDFFKKWAWTRRSA